MSIAAEEKGEKKMTKVEQIEELKDILLRESNRFYGLECDEACAYCEASAVYNAGYRKENKNYIGTDKVLRSIDYRPVEEVRKETAKEILILLGKGFDETKMTEFKNLPWYKVFYRELKQKYGVEVER